MKTYTAYKLSNTYILSLLCWVMITSCSKREEQDVVDVVIHLDKKYQVMDGFGASDAWRCQFVGKNWPLEKRKQMAQWLFSQESDEQGNPKGIGLSIWRFYIGAGSAEQQDRSGISNEWRRAASFVDAQGNYDWSKQEGQQWFLQQAKNAGVEHLLAFSIAAPTFWTYNGKGYSETKNGLMNLKKEHYVDYASFMTSFLEHFKGKGLVFKFLSPINEPQWDWEKATQEGTPATNTDIAALVKELDRQIEQKRLRTKIIVPEAADLRFLFSEMDKPGRANQINAFFKNAANHADTYLGNLSHVSQAVSGHSYFTTWPVDSLVRIRQKLGMSLEERKLGYWQSEFCILENTDDIGGGRPRDLGMDTALYVARVIHADITLANATSWQWWTALTNADYKDGLIYLDTGDSSDLYNLDRLKYDGVFHDSKLLWALGNYARFVRPGMQRIAVAYASDLNLVQTYKDVLLSAYQSEEGKVVLVAINYSKEGKKLKLTASNLNFDAAFETSQQKSLERISLVENNTITLAPRSITTLTGNKI